MPTRLTFEYVKDFINKEQLLISTEYINTKKLLLIKCHICNQNYSQNFDRYRKGHRHQKCQNFDRYEKSDKNKLYLKDTIRICIWCKKEYNPRRSIQKLCNKKCSISFLNRDKDFNILRGRKGGNNSMLVLNRRSKGEIYFYDLCVKHFNNFNITCNEQFFIDKNGNKWDADIIIHDLKIAVLYNGIFHYKKVYKNQKLERMIAKDRLKEKIITKNGYKFYTIKDMGSFNKKFVKYQFYFFLHKLTFKNVLEQLHFIK